jgi:hypothetical protein
MKALRRDAKVLKAKSIWSFRRSAEAFNSYDDDGRVTAVLLHLQHAFEMLLKAGLVQCRIEVLDPKLGRSIGMEKCINLGRQHLRLSESEAGLLRAVDALRDDEQHWFTLFSEGLLYAHVRGAVTLFDELLQREFSDRLATHLPARVLPISTELPPDIQLLIDAEYSQIQQLLEPGRRRRSEAQARIRSLLAMEAHAREDVRVSAKDVARVERAIRAGTGREQAFPNLSGLTTEVAGEGLTITVHFSRTAAGAPVRLLRADDPAPAAGVREVDLQRKYHWSRSKLAEKLGITTAKCAALRRHLNLDDKPSCCHVFVFGSQRHPYYSDNAMVMMREAMQHLDLDVLVRQGRRRAG